MEFRRGLFRSNKESISIEVLNGTGIGGEAGYLETQLKSLGYTDIKTGNASGATVSVTTITFNTSVSETVVSEITKKLEDIYQKVETKKSSKTCSYDNSDELSVVKECLNS